MNKFENFVHDKYGYCYYSLEPNKTPVIFNLFIEPEYRRIGHAKRLLKYIIREIRDSGYKGAIEIEAIPREASISLIKLFTFYKSLDLKVIENYVVTEKQL